MNKLTLIVFSLPFLSACSPSMPELPDLPSLSDISKVIPGVYLPVVYKADIHQGSVLERFKINQLKVDMSKAQVQDLIGSPSIIDPFHDNQWDYINHSTLHQTDDIRYRLVLKFDGDTLTDINTAGIDSLSQLTDKEKILEDKRIADEKAAAEAKVLEEKRIADEKAAAEAKAEAEAEAEAERIAQEIAAAEAAAAEAKTLEEKRIADEKAAAEAKAEAERILEANKPWYQF
ncbi:SmpA/OmlA domain protein [hydrothermal vent metagenome]|uniref:SmpA/OmlA domain protein n=1 Tax=hydrothermal vent metagenome TaxID=652676 RepID=A0A1W1DJQ9_9ZZZZ